MNKVFSVLQTGNMSLFDFYVNLDTNQSGNVNEMELKTGIQSMGLTLTR